MALIHAVCTMLLLWMILGINEVRGGSAPTTKAPHHGKQNPHSKEESSNSAIIGGAVGGSVAVITIVIIVVYCIRSRRRNQDLPDSKGNINQAYGNHSINDLKPPATSNDKREPYTNLNNAGQKVTQGNVYDDRGGVSNTDRTPNKDEDVYCYITDSDIIAAQRLSENSIPTIRQNRPMGPESNFSHTNPVSTSTKTSPSGVHNISDDPSKERQLSNNTNQRDDGVKTGQVGNQQIPASLDNKTPQTHEYLELEPERTSL